jgi:3-hydroxybutyryl-CoA dehydrogenase
VISVRKGRRRIATVDQVRIVTLIGAGKMGVKIAARAALFGFEVRVYDVSKDTLRTADDLIRADIQATCDEGAVKQDPQEAFGRVSFHPDLDGAIAGTDLIVEAVPENLDLKKEVFSDLDRIAAEHVIIATNSSSIPVSKIEDAVTRRDKVANIHFYARLNGITPMVDLMGGTETSPETMARSREWIEGIGCLPLVVKKGCMGFLFNRIWRAVKRESLRSWADGHADYKDIDRAWKVWSGMIAGPFGMMDFVGLDVVYDIEMSYYLDSNDPTDKPPEALRQMVERGELGRKSGKGFYDWSDPEFIKPEFIQPRKKP